MRRARRGSTASTGAAVRRRPSRPRALTDGNRTGSSRTLRAVVPLIALASLLASASPGCGYTVLKGGEVSGGETAPASRPRAGAVAESELPPGHPPIDAPEDWIGRSLLDDLLGDKEPLRFENMRAQRGAGAPGGKAIVTVRMITGDPALAAIWQIRMDAFGWVTATYWAQGAAGPRLDDLLATRRAEEFPSSARERGCAARDGDVALPRRRPTHAHAPARVLPAHSAGALAAQRSGAARDRLPHRDDRPRRSGRAASAGGQATVPLSLVQLLIGTWDDVPPRALRRAARDLAASQPLLVGAALLAEGIVLALEVEGPPDQELELPLRVGR